jgi:osmotically inducible protein OsmC
MALAGALARGGTPPTKLESEARTTFDKVGEAFRITKIELSIRAEVEGIDDEAFQQAAQGAKENCPVSQALKGNVEITLDAALI